MALLFNHVVVEVEIGGHVRWFDLTMRNQGGDFASEVIPWFGIGLPVAAGASLKKQPGSRAHGLYAVRETLELDTRRGEASVVEIRVRAEGWNADLLRRTRLAQGADGFAKERLAHARRRYGKVERVGGLEWRDDRMQNACELVETLEVREIANSTEGDQRAAVEIPGNLLMQSLALPEQKMRRAPWDLPRALELRHEICARARSMGAGERARRRWVCSEFAGTIEDTREKGCWRKVTRFSIQADAVPADRIDAYRQLLEQLLVATTWRLYLPWNESRVAARPEFGKLPAASEGIAAFVPAADIDDFADATPKSATTTILTPTPESFWSANWRYIVPVLVLAGGALTRTLETPSQLSGTLPPDDRTPFVRPSNPQDAVKFFESRKVAPEDEPLPRGPEINGEVFVDAGAVDVPPQAISRVPPNYPFSLRATNVRGSVLIEFVVTDEGIPTAITIVKQSHAAFGKAASVAVSKWRFKPAVKAGQPVNMKLRVPINFSLAD
jgi:TonB family protein